MTTHATESRDASAGFRDLVGHLTVADLLAADDPRTLLERLGCTVRHWHRRADTDRWSGLVEFPGRGWAGVHLGVVEIGQDWASWADPAHRLTLLWNLIEKPLLPPVANATEALLGLAAAVPDGDGVHEYWHEGMLLRRILADLKAEDPERYAQVGTLIGLAYPAAVRALTLLDAWVDNTTHSRIAEARELIRDTAVRRWPVVVTPMLAVFDPADDVVHRLMRTRYEDWPDGAGEALDACLAVPSSGTYKMLAKFWERATPPGERSGGFSPDLLH